MKSFLRICALIGSLGLAAHCWGATGSVSVASGQSIYISFSSYDADGEFILVNPSNGQTVADVVCLYGFSPYAAYLASGVSFSGGTLSGVPVGTYQLTLQPTTGYYSGSGWWDDWNNFWANGAEVLTLNDYSDADLYWEISIQ